MRMNPCFASPFSTAAMAWNLTPDLAFNSRAPCRGTATAAVVYKCFTYWRIEKMIAAPIKLAVGSVYPVWCYFV